MAYGAELVWAWSDLINNASLHKLQKVDGGDCWAALSFSGGKILLLSWGSKNNGVAFINEDEKKELLSVAKQTPPITGAIKSHLSGSEFISAEQLRRDRILVLNFKKTVGAGFSNYKKIIVELMERYSNIIIADENNVIIETAKHIYPADNPYRSVLPGLDYTMPPQITGLELENWLKAPSDEAFSNIIGFGRSLIKTIASLSIKEKAAILNCFYHGTVSSMIPQRINKYITISPQLLSPEAEQFSSMEAASKEIVTKPLLSVSTSARKKKISDLLCKEIKRRERQSEDIEHLLYEEAPEKYRSYGEIIVANMWKIPKGSSKADLTFYDENGIECQSAVPLNPAISPSQNAAVYFAKYKKITSAQIRASMLLDKVNAELEDLREELILAMRTDDGQSLTMIEEELGLAKHVTFKKSPHKAETKLPPHKRFDFEQALVYVGLSAKGNRYVTFRAASADDIWFHAQGVPGAHVVLRLKCLVTDDIKQEMLMFCSSLAVYFSKASANENVRVDYTAKKYVTPIKGSTANVTYKEFKSFIGERDFWEKYLLKNQQAH